MPDKWTILYTRNLANMEEFHVYLNAYYLTEDEVSVGDYTEALRKLGSSNMRESLNFLRRYHDALQHFATENVNSTDISRQYFKFIGKEGPDFINKLAEQNMKHYQSWLSNSADFMEQMFDTVWNTGSDHNNTQTINKIKIP